MASTPRDFWEAARDQQFCAACSKRDSFEAHHVIAKQRLKAIGKLELLYDPRNALRLCEGLDTGKCHAKLEIKTSDLLDQNICFIWDALNVAGQNYLERHYAGIDRRYSLHTEGACPLCQRQPPP